MVRPATGRSGARSGFAGHTAEKLAGFGKWQGNSSRRDVTCINEKNMVCERNQQSTNLFARKSIDCMPSKEKHKKHEI
jgi:hypothetical protein